MRRDKRVQGGAFKEGKFYPSPFASLSFRLGDSVRWVQDDGEK